MFDETITGDSMTQRSVYQTDFFTRSLRNVLQNAYVDTTQRDLVLEEIWYRLFIGDTRGRKQIEIVCGENIAAKLFGNIEPKIAPK